MCGMMLDLMICKFSKGMVIHGIKCPYWDQMSLNNTNQTRPDWSFHITLIVSPYDVSTGLITSFDLHPGQSWLAVGTSGGTHVCWDMRFHLPITQVRHPTSKQGSRWWSKVSQWHEMFCHEFRGHKFEPQIGQTWGCNWFMVLLSKLTLNPNMPPFKAKLAMINTYLAKLGGFY